MSGNLPRRRHGTHLPPQAYRRTQLASSPPPGGTPSWFEAATPADQAQLPESEWPTEDIDVTAATADTQLLPAVPADAGTQVIPAVNDQPPQDNPTPSVPPAVPADVGLQVMSEVGDQPPQDNSTPSVPDQEDTLVSSVLSDPWDIAFRDRLLTNLRRIRGFGER